MAQTPQGLAKALQNAFFIGAIAAPLRGTLGAAVVLAVLMIA
jgi:hypothetical protein